MICLRLRYTFSAPKQDTDPMIGNKSEKVMVINMDILKKLNGKKGSAVIAVLAVLGVILIMFPKGDTESKASKADTYVQITTYTEKLEEKIRSLCSAVDGAGNVRVLVTLECSSEFVYADNRTESVDSAGSSYSSDYLIIEDKNGTAPVTLTEIYPKIRGVAVVCDGGDLPAVKSKLTGLLSAALGISTSRISVSS